MRHCTVHRESPADGFSHLKILEEAGIIESRREGINIWYKIKSDEAVKIMNILGIEKIDYDGGSQCVRP